MAFALTEPLAGSDPSSMITKFEDKGEHFLLNGKKHWIGNGTIPQPMQGSLGALIMERSRPL